MTIAEPTEGDIFLAYLEQVCPAHLPATLFARLQPHGTSLVESQTNPALT
jgi:hypothetical protein